MQVPGWFLATVALSALAIGGAAEAQQSGMSFFVTSAGIGKGADLGGIEGADRHCQQLAQAAGAGGRTWHAYLSTQAADGKAFPPGEDKTCKNWTSSTQGTAIVGHIDRQGIGDDEAAHSWNSSHPSRGPDGGCSQADLRSTGGAGLFYCFAAN